MGGNKIAPDKFTVLLDKRESYEADGAKIGESALRGIPILKEGPTAVADSMESILNDGFTAVPTYAIIRGRALADKNDPVWNYHNTLAERITAYDEEGILGKKGATWVVDIQNGGMFVSDHERLRKAIKEGKLANGNIVLEQDDINNLLDAINFPFFGRIEEFINVQELKFTGNYHEFLEESDEPDFLDGMSSTYVVIRPVEEAIKVPSGLYLPIKDQMNNPNFIIAAGGRMPNQKMLERFAEFGWSEVHSYQGDYYKTRNGGCTIFLSDIDFGLVDDELLYDLGCFVGVKQEALNAFYDGKRRR